MYRCLISLALLGATLANAGAAQAQQLSDRNVPNTVVVRTTENGQLEIATFDRRIESREELAIAMQTAQFQPMQVTRVGGELDQEGGTPSWFAVNWGWSWGWNYYNYNLWWPSWGGWYTPAWSWGWRAGCWSCNSWVYFR